MQRAPLEDWQGEFGDGYTARNLPDEAAIRARTELWRQILWQILRNERGELPGMILEVGANVGQNLMALRRLVGPRPSLSGVEPNPKARELLQEAGFPATLATADNLPFVPGAFDLVFTSGVLVHISPTGQNHLQSPLRAACREIVRVSKRWVVAIEYFSAQPREIIYRERRGLLWARDFGQYYMDEFGLEPVACGFAWKALTGLDNLTWWLLKKP